MEKIDWLMIYNESLEESNAKKLKQQTKYKKALSKLNDQVNDANQCMDLYLSYLVQEKGIV